VLVVSKIHGRWKFVRSSVSKCTAEIAHGFL
jgi:hypothetical protein